MAWVTALVGLVGTYAASQSNPSSAEKSQGSLADLQQRIGSDQYQRYQQNYAPRERQLLDTVFDSGTTPTAEAARAGADASKAADVADQTSLRDARRLGINPSSPAFEAINRNNEANRAGLVASAKTYGRRYAADSNFQKGMGALSLGRNLVSTAGGLNASAFGMYGDIASRESAQDAAKGKLYGDTAGSLFDAAKQTWKPTQPTTASAPSGWNGRLPDQYSGLNYTSPTYGGSGALSDTLSKQLTATP